MNNVVFPTAVFEFIGHTFVVANGDGNVAVVSMLEYPHIHQDDAVNALPRIRQLLDDKTLNFAVIFVIIFGICVAHFFNREAGRFWRAYAFPPITGLTITLKPESNFFFFLNLQPLRLQIDCYFYGILHRWDKRFWKRQCFCIAKKRAIFLPSRTNWAIDRCLFLQRQLIFFLSNLWPLVINLKNTCLVGFLKACKKVEAFRVGSFQHALFYCLF